MTIRATRRRFLSALGTAGVGLGVGARPGQAAAGSHDARAAAAEPFYGAHQPGIATPSQEHLQFASLDMLSRARSDLQAVLAELSAAAARIMRGQPVGALSNGFQPPVDTGEALGLGPARVTVTFGLGPSIFQPGRFGLTSRRPAPLVHLPHFAGDALVSEWSGGDIGIQVCAEDPQVAFHAVHDLVRLASPTATPRWILGGAGKTSNSRRQGTPRNLMGFKDGTANIMVEDHAAMNRFVWTGAPESPAWMHGGSYMVVRRINMLFGHWDELDLAGQEAVFGRHKVSGAPLGGVHEHDPLDLHARSHGRLVIPGDAHVRRASPALNQGERILRRGYSYMLGLDADTATVAGGQLFICFQRDPRRQFIPINRRLQGEALAAHTEHVGSAIFACPPGARPGGYVGEGLFS
ncbi:MAG TPA: iron uptake transporter deferrochelatase/peroxidase subunit [Solirubrobacteraceae bacterium]|nr:iron uptake transporter deferrochelatase/peroxidase subunit [Solirubrobacteraceae bacterium]